MTKCFIVWNDNKTEGYVTTDPCLAHEVCKSSETNCYTEEGLAAPVAMAFCERWGLDDCQKEVYESSNLISAAPELLEALENALQNIIHLGATEEWHQVRQYRLIIAKAKGL